MNIKKIILANLIFLIFLNTTSYSLENKIILKINGDIITSLDIKNESKYLRALNPKIGELNDAKIFEISKNSLIREKIKKIKILKNTSEAKVDNVYLKNIIEARYKSLGLKNKDEFINYLENFGIEINTIEKKIEIEALWNQLIFIKFSKNVKIDKNDLMDKIQKNKNLSKTKEYYLKEIVFNIEENSNVIEKYNLIKKSIEDIGFENTASIYSISDTAKTGGILGWINKNSLSSKINESLSKLKINEYSKPIVLPGGFLILKISDERITEKKINVNTELKKMVNAETNSQLNQFSNIYFNKIKQEISIDEI